MGALRTDLGSVQTKGSSLTVNTVDDFMQKILTSATLTSSDREADLGINGMNADDLLNSLTEVTGNEW